MDHIDGFSNLNTHTLPGKFVYFYEIFCELNFTGERTFGVLTKIDLMDKGTDAGDVRLPIFFLLLSFELQDFNKI